MPMEMILTIVGSFLVLMLGINGFFLRGIFQDLNAVKLQLAVSIERSNHKERRIGELEEKAKDLEDEVKTIKLSLNHIQ